MSKAPIIILEGTWWKNNEVPQVLPYFNALANSEGGIDLSYRTIRSSDDIGYYVSKIPKNAGAMLYFACHGEDLHLKPAGGRAKIPHSELLAALGKAKAGAVSFVHFSCCEMIDPKDERDTHQKILDATRAKWSSGYTKDVDWLQSMLLELALVNEIFSPQHNVVDGGKAKINTRAKAFLETYEQLARKLGFSALSKVTGGAKLFPE